MQPKAMGSSFFFQTRERSIRNMLIFSCVLHCDFYPEVRTINKEYYHEFIRHLRKTILRERTDL